MNATDSLLNALKTSDENLNILLAMNELETFVMSYSKEHLTSANDTKIERRKEYGMCFYHDFVQLLK